MYSVGLHSASQCTEYTGAHFRCLYTSACSRRNKHKKLETLAQYQNYNIMEQARFGGKNPVAGML